MHSIFLLLLVFWDGKTVSKAYTENLHEAREDYEKARDDKEVKHARLFQNPVPNGGTYDNPVNPEIEAAAAAEAAAAEASAAAAAAAKASAQAAAATKASAELTADIKAASDPAAAAASVANPSGELQSAAPKKNR